MLANKGGKMQVGAINLLEDKPIGAAKYVLKNTDRYYILRLLYYKNEDFNNETSSKYICVPVNNNNYWVGVDRFEDFSKYIELWLDQKIFLDTDQDLLRIFDLFRIEDKGEIIEI